MINKEFVDRISEGANEKLCNAMYASYGLRRQCFADSHAYRLIEKEFVRRLIACL